MRSEEREREEELKRAREAAAEEAAAVAFAKLESAASPQGGSKKKGGGKKGAELSGDSKPADDGEPSSLSSGADRAQNWCDDLWGLLGLAYSISSGR